eukprot:m.935387 g.935387  ORF g.935387 m.935387 type:complete len:72 (-) comp23804_c0_seq1:2187-2402(-)
MFCGHTIAHFFCVHMQYERVPTLVLYSYVGVVVAGKGDAFVEGATGMWAAVAFALAGVALIFASSITPNTS